ncbi:hypothetical protein OWR21_03740 [Ralstonia sp. 1B3]
MHEVARANGVGIRKAQGRKEENMAMVRMFVSEWQGFAGTVRASQAEVPMLSGMPGSAAGGCVARVAESARLQRKWVRKQIGLTTVAAGAMIVLLHGMVQLMV